MPEISGLYLQREEEGGRGERKGFRERKINISLDFVVLISEEIDDLFSCLFKSNRGSY